jgi:hypothetical protein
MDEYKINISTDFSPTPGPRYITEGKYSGEMFRQKLLFPLVNNAIINDKIFEVNLDGTAGYATSFLEESFGGLIRIHHLPYDKIVKLMVLISEEEDYLIDDIHEYLNDAHEEFRK